MIDTDEPIPSTGLPGWVMTFADLMTLLMCFFVLLLSFSEMDVAKFKQLAGSMQNAFGVQTEIDARSMPKGTSMIAQEFSPATPQPTVLNEVRQFTATSDLNTLDVVARSEDLLREERLRELERLEREAAERARQLRAGLRAEIEAGTVEVRLESANVVVRILEQNSFASGRAELDPAFRPTLEKIGTLLASMEGAIAVSGHTDNVPISNSQFRSNWDLSAARGASVAHELLAAGIAPERLAVSGHADTQPRAPNDTPENRALNRRIDVTLFAGRERHGGWALPIP